MKQTPLSLVRLVDILATDLQEQVIGSGTSTPTDHSIPFSESQKLKNANTGLLPLTGKARVIGPKSVWPVQLMKTSGRFCRGEASFVRRWHPLFPRLLFCPNAADITSIATA